MMKLRAVDELGAKIALTEKCGMVSEASAAVVVEWAAVDLARMSEFGGGV
jgi:hypothetical protein